MEISPIRFGERQELWGFDKKESAGWKHKVRTFFIDQAPSSLKEAVEASEKSKQPVALSFIRRKNHAAIELITGKDTFDTFCAAKGTRNLNEANVWLIDATGINDIAYLNKHQKNRLLSNNYKKNNPVEPKYPMSEHSEISGKVVATSKLASWPIQWKKLKAALKID